MKAEYRIVVPCPFCKKKVTVLSNSINGNCPECGAPLEKKNGKRGEFLSCSNFPKCRFSKDID